MENSWILIESGFPPSGTRCLVTDGYIVIIATYLMEEGGNVWIFSGLDESSGCKIFKVKAWTNLPKIPEITEQPTTKNNTNEKQPSDK